LVVADVDQNVTTACHAVWPVSVHARAALDGNECHSFDLDEGGVLVW